MKPNDKKKTKTSTKNVIITSVTYIVVALLGFWGGDKYKNENFNTNQQNIIINVDGKKFKINSNDYESLLNDYDGLSIEYDNLLYEYNNLSNEYDNLLNEYKHLLETTDSKKESDNSDNAISAINMETFHCYRVDFDREAIKDKKGNSFINALIFHHIKLINNKDDRYYNLEYQLDGKYSRVTATLAFCEKNGEGWSNEELYFEIYVDDEIGRASCRERV